MDFNAVTTIPTLTYRRYLILQALVMVYIRSHVIAHLGRPSFRLRHMAPAHFVTMLGSPG
jgi:hypothetical protein